MASDLPRYFTANEVRIELDKHRRRYRRSVILLVIYQIIVIGPTRLAVDTLMANPRLVDASVIKPFVMPGMVAMVILIWLLGLPSAFRRRY